LPKFMMCIVPVLAALLFAATQANAQGVSAYFGLGSAFNSSATEAGCPSGQVVDPFAQPASCTPVNGMGGVFGVFGADFMIKPHLGINGEYTFRFSQSDYMPSESLKIRPAFYDFNAVYQPTAGDKSVVPVIEGGIGGAKMSFYFSQSNNLFSQSLFVVSSSHFQVHGAAGVKWYFKGDAFIKPQIDLRYVPHLNDQYGRNFVPEVTVSIGYSFGRE
jgi:Outer membrane protein beta-barrel domain